MYEELINNLKGSNDPDTRRSAAEELSKLETFTEAIIEAFVAGLTDEDSGVRNICSIALINTPEHLKPIAGNLLVPLLKSKDIEIINLVSDILKKLGSPVKEAVYPYLEDDDSVVRQLACDIIGAIGNEEAYLYLVDLLDDINPNVILSAIEAIGNLKLVDAVDKLIELYDTNEDFKANIIDSLGKIGGEQAEIFLLNCLKKETDLFLKVNCIDSLALCGTEVRLIDDLIEIIEFIDDELKPIILKTMYAIATRNNVELTLPPHLRPIAQKSMFELDPDLRAAGLIALGNEYREDDVPALVNEALYNNPDTQQYILERLLLNSPPNVVSAFFDKYFNVLEADSSELFFISVFPQIWAEAKPENVEKAILSIINAIITNHYTYMSDILELLISLNKNKVVECLELYYKNASDSQKSELKELAEMLNLNLF